MIAVQLISDYIGNRSQRAISTEGGKIEWAMPPGSP